MNQVSDPSPAADSRLTFCGLSIAYDHRVLEPRPWTEAQSQWAAELLPDAPAGPVLELCAGVGHIGLGAVRAGDRDLVMVDVNPVAREFAVANAAANGLGSRVEFRLARIDEALGEDELFPLIIADPPWVRSAETSRFPADPVLAIDGGDDGLDLARTCADLIVGHLTGGGSALLQLGNTAQAELIAAYAGQRSDGAVSAVETRVFDRGVVVRLTR
ncbi:MULTISPECIES: methyltransferase [Citricoccus]|uniref:methyltransferase n=1 Tax=Citricoccus TaxID=169133 RepID=UPI000255EDF2|nr:class I SAM-dependent methyltransferase [Citricoccus sp. CH26A]